MFRQGSGKESVRKRLAAALIPFFLSPLTAPAGAGMPGMKMHVFEERNNDAALTVTTSAGNGAVKSLKMLVFDGGGASRMPHENVSNAGSHDLTTHQPAAVPDEYQRRQSEQAEMTVKSYAEVGYRNDELKWNIAAPNGTPNILSELQWYNVHSAVITGGTDIALGKHWQVEGKMSYGKIAAGQNQDSDYGLDNRQGEFSRSYSSSNDGMTIDLSADLGYRLTLGRNHRAPYWRFTPKVGYAFHTQQFNDTRGVQVIPNLGSFDGLNSTYEGAWFGPWGGLATQLAFTERFSLQAAAEYHWIDYKGTGNWNLRSDFQHPKSFTHKSGGEGIVLSAVARYLLTPDWIVRLSAHYQDWQANDSGKDTTYFSDGSAANTPLNEVKWKSYGLNLGVEYIF